MSDITSISDAFVESYTRLLPELASDDGITDHDDKWRDWSLDGLEAQRDLYRDGQAKARRLAPVDRWDRLAHRVFVDEMDRQLAWYESDGPLRDLNHVYSGLQQIRDSFDQMSTTTAEECQNVLSRLRGLPEALAGYTSRLDEGRRRGATVQLRQVQAAAEQARTHGSDSSGLHDLGSAMDKHGLADSFRESLTGALEAFTAFADYLETSYAGDADPGDGVGRERYLAGVRRWVGSSLDPEETYEWGWSEVRRLWGEMEALADQIAPGAGVQEALEILKTDPSRVAHSREQFLEIMDARQQQALADLQGSHFDVPEQIRTLKVRFAPPGNSLGAWYTAPTEDFSRSGEVWYSAPPDQTVFPLYDEITTAYHEGFPGHHLQIGLVACYSDLLTRFHRKVVWMSGSGEGWALYAEQFMRELGYLEKPDYVMGLLASQMFRSCRIAVDIGFHLGLPIPADTSGVDLGDTWTFESATKLMRERAFLAPPNAVSEVTRYLGWPGQAISYKVGEQAILDLRDAERSRLGPDFDLKDFHQRVLEAGAVSLDVMQRVVLDGTTDAGQRTRESP